MAFKIIWSPKAEITFQKVIDYLREKWTEKEAAAFISKTDKVIFLMSAGILQFRKSEKKNIHQALITKHNLLLYRIHKD